MKISILSSNLSDNTLGRAYLLGKVLSRRHQIEIIGPTFGKEIWKPLQDEDIEFKTIQGTSLPYLFFNRNKILKLIGGDVIYASKPLLMSFGVGLLIKMKKEIPLVLDIDDWQLGGFSKKWVNRFYSFSKILRDPDSFPILLVMDSLIHLADRITTASKFLQEKYGGTSISHCRDIHSLNPNNFDREKGNSRRLQKIF